MRLGHLDDLISLILVRAAREKSSTVRRWLHDQLRENASRAPHVNRFVVLPLAQQHLGRPVPPRHNVLRKPMIALAPRLTEVTDANIAILADKSAGDRVT